MKGSGTLVASVVAASTVALSSSASSPSASDSLGFASTLGTDNAAACNSHASSSDKRKFAPRFDGLRFIETLVTAHR